MIELRNVSIKYGELEVIKSLSLIVEKGEFFTLLGPSGCGKTTVLRAIAGFVPVTAGTILIDGKDVTKVPPEKRDVGIVFQNYALFPHMTVTENVSFGLKVAKKAKPSIEVEVARILNATGIANQKDKKPAELSGGQQQRVAIARSLVMGTQVLLFDEPLSNLDANVRDDMRREIKRLQRELDFTAVFVTHDQEEALSMSDRLLVFNNGIADQIGTSRELYEEPTTPFVCQFVGSSNQLTGQICEKLDLPPNHQHFIRPEHVRVVPASTSDALPAMLVDVDYLGSTTLLTLDLVDSQITSMALSSPDNAILKLGEQVGLLIPKSSIFSFGETA